MEHSTPGLPVYHQLQEFAKLMSIESVMPSNHLILCRPLILLPSIFPSIRDFTNEFFALGGQCFGVSASASVLPMNTQDWSPLGWTGWISLQFEGLSRVVSIFLFLGDGFDHCLSYNVTNLCPWFFRHS